MKKVIVIVIVLVLALAMQIRVYAESGLLSFDTETEREDIYERKITHKKSDADVFMASLDDVMKEALVRSVISENDEIKLAKMLKALGPKNLIEMPKG